MDDASSYGVRRNFAAEYFNQYADKRTSGKSVCTGSSKCADSCNPNNRYDSSTTCGLTCYDSEWKERVGSKGTCQRSSNACAGAASTFCPGGTYTSIRNNYANNPSYFDCNNGYGCGDKGGCCVRIAGTTAKTWQYYCLKCDNN